MSAGMAEVIAAHDFLTMSVSCLCGNWAWPDGARSKVDPHAAHVAEQLTRAGYGLLPDVAPEYGARTMLVNGLSEEPEPHGPNPNPSWFSKSTHVRLVGPWQELQSLPDPIAAALPDPEGHALVQAIHDRKAE